MTRPIYTHWKAAPEGSEGVCDTMTSYPGVPVRLDLERSVGKHSLVYEGPATHWAEGLPLGNGDVAAMVHQPGDVLRWSLTKSDIRDLRHPVIPFHRHEEWLKVDAEHRTLDIDWMNEEEWEYKRNCNFPCFLPAGSVSLSRPNREPFTVERQTLDLYKALHSLSLSGGVSAESFVFYGANVLAIRIKGLKGATLVASLSPEGIPPDVGAGTDDTTPEAKMRREEFREIGFLWTEKSGEMKVDYVDGHRAFTLLQVQGGVFTNTSAAGHGTVELAIQEDELVLLLTITTGREGAYLKRRAEHNLGGAWQRGFTRLLNDHRVYWHERWSRSSICLPEPDRILESLWHFAVYTMVSSSRSSYPVPLMSAWNAQLLQPYHGDYHNNINSQMCYWPVFAANHADLARSYVSHFWSVMPEMEAETRRIWGMPGIRIPFASAGKGYDFWGVGYWKYELFVSGWTAQIAWWHYEATLDKQFLGSCGYPLMKAVADFYFAYLRKDAETGKLSLPFSKLCEDTVFNASGDQKFVKNCGLDLAAIHSHLRDTAKAAAVLGLDADRTMFENAVAELAPLPVEDGEFTMAHGLARNLPISHPVLIAAIHPSALVTALGPAGLLPIARKTLKNLWRCSSRITKGGSAGRLHWNDDLSMGWIGAARSWMADGDGARDAILNGWVAGCLKTNGFLSCQARRPEERARVEWMQNQLCGLAHVVNEMLLQSHSGVIQVFPAAPAEWNDASFVRLRATGAFLVSAARKGGETLWIAVESDKGGRATILNPWPSRKKAFMQTRSPQVGGAPKEIEMDSNGLLDIDLAAGETILLTPDGREPVGIVPGSDAPGEGPWSIELPALATVAGEPETWISWWGKPKAAKGVGGS